MNKFIKIIKLFFLKITNSYELQFNISFDDKTISEKYIFHKNDSKEYIGKSFLAFQRQKYSIYNLYHKKNKSWIETVE